MGIITDTKAEEVAQPQGMIEDFIYKELENLFSIPCNYSPMDEIMLESGRCEDDCGKVSGADGMPTWTYVLIGIAVYEIARRLI